MESFLDITQLEREGSVSGIDAFCEYVSLKGSSEHFKTTETNTLTRDPSKGEEERVWLGHQPCKTAKTWIANT